MLRIKLLIGLLINSLASSAFNFRPEIDGDGELFFVTGDDAISGIIMLFGCIAISFICYKIAGLIDKENDTKGIRKIFSTILYIIACFACIVAIGLAFALWWITLILVVGYAIGYAIYEKINSKN